jgi:carboxylesterase type B
MPTKLDNCSAPISQQQHADSRWWRKAASIHVLQCCRWQLYDRLYLQSLRSRQIHQNSCYMGVCLSVPIQTHMLIYCRADTNDGTIFTPRSTGSIQSMNTFLKNQFPFLTPQHLAQINNYYPMAEQYVGAGQYWRAVSNAYGDMRYMCPGLYLSSVYSNATIPVWTYHYNVIDPPSNATGYGVLHTAETTAIWGPSFVSGGAPKSYFQLNAPIVPLMQGYWTSFIRSKNPNTYRAEGAPLWENWVASKQNRLRINLANTSMETVDETQQKHCAYLTSIGSVLQQ